MSPFQTVLTELERMIPRMLREQRFYLTSTGIIQVWLGRGFDPGMDILPTVKSVLAKNPSFGTLEYFTPAIEAAYTRRKESEPTNRPGSPASDELKALHIAKVKAKYKNIVMPSEFAWLEQYEAVHGPVAI